MCKEIPLSRGQVSVIDDCDTERVEAFKWSLDRNGYAVRMVSCYVDGKRTRRKELLHRAILNAPAHLQVDHINHDPLDNRRCNLRLVTSKQNRANSRPNRNGTSRFKGVHWHKRDKRWCATIWVGDDRHWIGTFSSEVDAARAYDQRAIAFSGEHAFLNFPDELHLISTPVVQAEITFASIPIFAAD